MNLKGNSLIVNLECVVVHLNIYHNIVLRITARQTLTFHTSLHDGHNGPAITYKLTFLFVILQLHKEKDTT